MEFNDKENKNSNYNLNIKEGRISISKLGIYLSGKTDTGEIFTFSLLHEPELVTVGVNNICDDGRFVVFLDYDNITFEDLLDDLTNLSRDFNLSHFIVIKTRENSYHAVCLEKFTLPQVQKIIDHSLCDYSYKRFPVKIDKGWILRITDKFYIEDGKIQSISPSYVGLLKFGRPKKRSISRAHLELFARLHPDFRKDSLEFFRKEDLDDLNKVRLVRYGTSDKMRLNINIPFVFSKNLVIEMRDGDIKDGDMS